MDEKSQSAEVLKFAAGLEEDCIRFYEEMELRRDSEYVRGIFREFKMEENIHLQRIETILHSGQFVLTPEFLQKFRTEDYSDAEGSFKQRSCMENLSILMRKEKALFKLYTFIALGVSDNIQRLLFESMANDESRHKLKLEIACE